MSSNPETRASSDILKALKFEEEFRLVSSFDSQEEMNEWLNKHPGAQMVFVKNDPSTISGQDIQDEKKDEKEK